MFKQKDKPMLDQIIRDSKNGRLSEIEVAILVDALESYYMPLAEEIDAMLRDCGAEAIREEIKRLVKSKHKIGPDIDRTIFVNEATEKVLRRQVNHMGRRDFKKGEYTVFGLEVRTEYEGKPVVGWPFVKSNKEGRDE